MYVNTNTYNFDKISCPTSYLDVPLKHVCVASFSSFLLWYMFLMIGKSFS